MRAVQALVESLLQVDAAQRLTASAVRVHPWVLGCAPSRAPQCISLAVDARAAPARRPALHFSLEAQAALLAAPLPPPAAASLEHLWRQQRLLSSHGALLTQPSPTLYWLLPRSLLGWCLEASCP